jgi:hypothetical protein
MLITKLHLGVALFASAYLYYSNPTTSSTNYLPISEIQQKTPLQKVWMTEKKSMLFCIQCHQANGKGMALISHLRRIKLAYRKRTQSIHALKFD